MFGDCLPYSAGRDLRSACLRGPNVNRVTEEAAHDGDGGAEWQESKAYSSSALVIFI